jgi:hypothetical protein
LREYPFKAFEAGRTKYPMKGPPHKLRTIPVEIYSIFVS